MSDFGSEIRRFVNRAKERQELALKKCAFDLFAEIIMRTPVDTGRLRGNWQTTENSPATGEVDDIAKGPVTKNGSGSSPAKDRAAEVIDNAGAGVSAFVLTNNLPYVSVIEYGGSDQMPEGMVRVATARWQPRVSDIVSALK